MDDRDALAARVEAQQRQLDKAQSRAAAVEAALALERESAAARSHELGTALEGANARCALLTAESQEVSRLNLALQRRLEKSEAKVEKLSAAKADSDAKVAAARNEAAAASDSASRLEKEAHAMSDRVRQLEGRAQVLEKANALLREERDAAKQQVAGA